VDGSRVALRCDLQQYLGVAYIEAPTARKVELTGIVKLPEPKAEHTLTGYALPGRHALQYRRVLKGDDLTAAIKDSIRVAILISATVVAHVTRKLER